MLQQSVFPKSSHPNTLRYVRGSCEAVTCKWSFPNIKCDAGVTNDADVSVPSLATLFASLPALPFCFFLPFYPFFRVFAALTPPRNCGGRRGWRQRATPAFARLLQQCRPRRGSSGQADEGTHPAGLRHILFSPFAAQAEPLGVGGQSPAEVGRHSICFVPRPSVSWPPAYWLS